MSARSLSSRFNLRGLLVATAFTLSAVPAAPLRAADTARPKIIVAVVVDQLRADYLERFQHQFVEGGFRLLTEGGAHMTFAHYDYFPTVTAPGHASVFSGAPPAIHGIIGNEWYDKTLRKQTYCCGDATVTGVGTTGKEGQMSPRKFIGGNFADELRLRFKSKVVGISIKDRGAILPAGRQPAGAFWFEAKSGNFITSSYYMVELPEWVRTFNERKIAHGYLGETWNRLLDESAYEHADNLPGEGNLPGEKKPVFPHRVIRPLPSEEEEAEPGAVDCENILSTPFSNQLLAEFARAAIDGEQLGQGPGPDFLSVSFSAIDACGHRFGPHSQEVQDITLRLDRQLADLFRYLRGKFGLENVLIMMTADHGVMPTPEYARQQGIDGQRLDEVPLMSDLLSKISERFGSSNLLLSKRIYVGNIYFNHEALREHQIAAADLAAFIREWALDTGKFHASYSRDQLLDGRVSGQIGERVFHGYNAERSGDVVLVFKPFIMGGTGKTGTTHGSPYAYDSHVPVIFYGAAFRPGRYADDFKITDIVPTLSAALRMNEAAGSIGKPFIKALANEGPAEPKAQAAEAISLAP